MTVRTRAQLKSDAASNLPDNTAAQISPADVRGQFDNVAESVRLPEDMRVRASTTANITISTALNNGDTLDGITLATGDLVLVKDQSSAAENGVYVVGVTPARASGYDTYDKHPGALITVLQGTANAGKTFRCSSNVGGTLGSTGIAFADMGAGAAEDSIPAEDFVPPITNGAQAGIRVLGSNGQALFYYAFDTATQEILYAKWLPKKRYDGGTITFAPIWTAESGSGTVEFELSAVACSNDDPLDAAFGTAQASADTLTTAGDNHTGPTSSAITIAGTFADGDFVWLKLVRDVANDTLGVDAQFLGLKIFYTTDQANDA